VLAGLACLGTGCGGSSTLGQGTHSGQTQEAQQTPPLSNPDVGGAKTQTNKPKAGKGGVHRHSGAAESAPATKHRSTQRSHVHSAAAVQNAVATPTSTKDDHGSTGAHALNPCTLVSAGEARAITGGGIVATSEAPLGPTCLYLGSHSRPQITLALESTSYSQASRRLDKRTEMLIRGHQAACGRLGRQMLFVRVGPRRVLNVTAPCSVARQFAVLAVSRLAA
jgi:hypothetical protein